MVENQWNICRISYLDNAIFQPSKLELVLVKTCFGKYSWCFQLFNFIHLLFRFVSFNFNFFRSVYFSFSFLLFDAPISERRRRVRHGWLITGAYSFNSMTHQERNLFFNFLGLRRENTMKVKWTRDPWTKIGRLWTMTRKLTNLGQGKSQTYSDWSVHGYLNSNVKMETRLKTFVTYDAGCRSSCEIQKWENRNCTVDGIISLG